MEQQSPTPIEPEPRPLSRAEGQLLNWAVLVGLEVPIGAADLPVLARRIAALLRRIDMAHDATPLGTIPGHFEDVARAFAAGRRDWPAEQRLRYATRGYFLRRQSRAEQSDQERR